MTIAAPDITAVLAQVLAPERWSVDPAGIAAAIAEVLGRTATAPDVTTDPDRAEELLATRRAALPALERLGPPSPRSPTPATATCTRSWCSHCCRGAGLASCRLRSSVLPAGMAVSPVFHGTPDEVTADVLGDLGLAAADEIVLFLPPGFGLDANVRLITDLATTVAPALGWSAG